MMKFHIENFGPIGKADIEWGNLTLLCGKNNTGKSYISYSLYCLFKMLTPLMSFSLPDSLIKDLMKRGEITFDLADYIPQYLTALQGAIPEFLRLLPACMAMHPDKLRDTRIALDITTEDILNGLHNLVKPCGNVFEDRCWCSDITTTCRLNMKFAAPDSSVCVMTLENKEGSLPAFNVIAQFINGKIPFMFNTGEVPFPQPFIITCERTGANLVRKVLTILNDLSTSNEQAMTRRMEINRKLQFFDYQLPVRKDINFTLEVASIVKKQSRIEQEYPHIISRLEEIAGGKYQYDDQTKQVLFFPEGTSEKIRMEEASSTVRSMMELYFYLKHQAKNHDLLIIDEPEQNLHPENQRRLARLLAMLINAGIKVLVSTHSDYIVKEFNTLLMLDYEADPRMPDLRRKYGYSEDELLKAEQVRVYYVENGTAVLQEVSQDVGVAIESFDETIRQMGIIQRDILYGGRQNGNA